MKKILLIFEDYNELTTTEVYLKKVGFDALGIGNESKLPDQLLAFNPDIVVAKGTSARVSSLSVGAKLKENARFHGKVVIILPQGYKPSPQDLIRIRMDSALEAPVDPIRLLQILSKFCHLDPVMIVEKFQRATLSDPDLNKRLQEPLKASVKKPDSVEEKIPTTFDSRFQDAKRAARYDKFLKDPQVAAVADLKATTFERKEVKDRQEALKKDLNPDELVELDRLKQEFAKALFKK